ncbi:cytochrome P450 [Aspergillus navahoensis]
MSSQCKTALVGCLTYWIIWIIYTRWFHPLARFPGPFWAFVSRAEKTQRKLHEKYGPVVRIAPNELVTSDPAAAKTFYTVKSGTGKAGSSNVYSMSSVLQSEKYIDACINIWDEKLGEIADRKESFDLGLWTRMRALLHQDLGSIAASDDLIPVQFLAGKLPTNVRSLFLLTGLLLKSDSNTEPQGDDFLGKLPDFSHQIGKELDIELDDFKVESFAVYAKLASEIDAAVVSRQLSIPHITYNEATKLSYLTTCIKEGIRMHPITRVSFPRHVPSPDCAIGGYRIPGRARIGVNPGVIHFDKSVFGEDADVFRPFGMGISMCEIYKAIPQLLQSFALELGVIRR